MDKKKHWTEYLKELTSLVIATIGLIGPLVSFIYIAVEHPQLIFTILVLIILLYIFWGCLYIAFSRRWTEIHPQIRVWRFPKYRIPALAGTILIPLILLSLGLAEPNRERLVSAFITPTPISCFPPAREGEALIAVTNLIAHEGTDYDAQSRIATGVNFAVNQAQSDLQIRMELCNQSIRTLEEAQALREQLKATLVIWGFYDQYGITIFYTTTPEVAALDSSAFEPEPITILSEKTKFNIAQNLGPDTAVWGFFAVAQTLQASARYEEAIKTYGLVLTNAANKPISGSSDLLLITNVQIGVIYDDFLGKPETAHNFYKKAVEHIPETENGIVYRYRGIAFRQLGKLEAARADAVKSIALDPTYADPHLDLAIMDYRDGKLEPAIEHLRDALELEPDFAIAHYYAGLVNSARHDPKTAYSDFSQAIHSDPMLYVAYYQRAILAYKTKDVQLEQILNDLSIAVNGSPNFGNPRLFRAMVYLNADDTNPNLAIDDLNILIAEFPNLSNEALLYRGYAFYRLNDYESALTDLNRLIEEEPDQYHTYYFRGLVLEAQKNYSLAIEDFNRVIEKHPENAVAYYHRGLNYLYLGGDNLQFAEEDLLKSMELFKSTKMEEQPIRLYLVLADLYLAKNESCEAHFFYQEYIKQGGTPNEGYDNITCSP